MTIVIPPRPDVPDAQRGRGALPLRYEDVAQDGRCNARPLSHALGLAAWRALERHPVAAVIGRTGAIPILSRLVVRAGGGPVSVRGSLSCEGCFAIVRAAAPDGADRYRVDMWASVEGARGRTWGAPPDGAGEAVVVGEVYGEHTLTRLFAPPDERRVRALPDGVNHQVAVLDASFSASDASAALPDGARWVDDAWVTDPGPVVFGLGHTDSNLHVNSLVYPQLFEEAALRRADALGLGADRFAGAFDVGFRKPFFAGERAKVVVRAYRRGDALGVAGAVMAADVAFDARALAPRAHAYGRVELVG